MTRQPTRLLTKVLPALSLVCVGTVLFLCEYVPMNKPLKMASFQNRTAAWWEQELQTWEVFYEVREFTGNICRFRRRKVVPFTDMPVGFDYRHCAPQFSEHPLMQGNPEAVPVLLQLTESDNPTIRLVALECLGRFSELPQQSIDMVFMRAINDTDESVRNEARSQLRTRNTGGTER